MKDYIQSWVCMLVVVLCICLALVGVWIGFDWFIHTFGRTAFVLSMMGAGGLLIVSVMAFWLEEHRKFGEKLGHRRKRKSWWSK